jgi:hypothetical protein
VRGDEYDQMLALDATSIDIPGQGISCTNRGSAMWPNKRIIRRMAYDMPSDHRSGLRVETSKIEPP